MIVNSSIQFSCTGTGDTILFLVNGTSINSLASEGFKQTPNQDILDESMIRRNMTLTSATDNLNNTEIVCFIESFQPNEANQSDETVIRVQDIKYTRRDHI